MKKLLTILAICLIPGNAWAWGRGHCYAVEYSATTQQLAKHCHHYIAPQGVISHGRGEGQKWGDLYPQYNWDYSKWEKKDKLVGFRMKKAWASWDGVRRNFSIATKTD